MKSELVIIEDGEGMAEECYAQLNLRDEIDAIKYPKDIQQTKELISTNGVSRSYIVDINLGPGKKTEGIEIIKEIIKVEPHALIIVYTAYPKYEIQSLKAGATLFFIKKAMDETDNFNKFRKLILAVKNNIEKISWEKEETFYSRILDINTKQKVVLLEYKTADKSVWGERLFPLTHFSHISKLKVGKPIIVNILENPGDYRIKINEGNVDYFNEEKIDISGLANSALYNVLKK